MESVHTQKEQKHMRVNSQKTRPFPPFTFFEAHSPPKMSTFPSFCLPCQPSWARLLAPRPGLAVTLHFHLVQLLSPQVDEFVHAEAGNYILNVKYGPLYWCHPQILSHTFLISSLGSVASAFPGSSFGSDHLFQFSFITCSSLFIPYILGHPGLHLLSFPFDLLHRSHVIHLTCLYLQNVSVCS